MGIVLIAGAAGCGGSSKTVTAQPSTTSTENTTPPTSTASTSTSATSSGPLTIGQAATLVGSSGEIFKVTVKRVVDPLPPVAFSSTGKRFVGVVIKIRNIGSAEYSDSPSNSSTLVTTDGQQYSDATIAYQGAACDGSFGSGANIAPGDFRSGCIAFKVPDGARLDKFQFSANGGLGPGVAEWNLRK